MKEFYNDYLDKNHKFDRWTMVGILALLIVITGCFGWLYEFIFYFFNGGMKTFYWRGGNFLPWINIYATGSVMIYYLTYKHRKKPYNQEILNFGNIGGFVCLRSVMFFGLSALLLMYVIIPFLFFLAKKLNKKVFLTISITLCSIILFDEFYNLLFARILNLPRAYDVYSKLGIPYVKFK